MEWLSIRKALSYSEIENLEKELKIKLPEDYKNLIGAINGGALKNAYISHPILGDIAYSRNISLNKEAKTNIFELLPTVNRKEQRYFPFGNVGNGDLFCFDLLENKVVLYVHEKMEMRDVCKTFTQLMNMIQQDDAN